jgi:hypothetical protein
MPKNLYDEEGNLVENAYLPDEVKELESNKAKYETEIGEYKSKLSKMENKDYNFKKLRDMTEEEVKKLSAQEMEYKTRLESIEEKERGFVEKTINSYKDNAFNQYAGEDEELKKKIQFHYDRIKDDATTQEEINTKTEEAYLLATKHTRPNPIHQAVNLTGSAPMRPKSKSYADTDDGRGLAEELGMTFINKDKK